MLTVKDAFKATSFAKDLPPEVVEAISQCANVERYSSDTIIFREGTVHDQFGIVVEGSVGLAMHVPGRGSLRILSVGRGEVLGWSPLLGGGAMTATARVIDDAVILSANGAELRQLCERDHNVGYYVYSKLAMALSARLLATRLQMLDVFSRDAPQIQTDPTQSRGSATGRNRT